MATVLAKIKEDSNEDGAFERVDKSENMDKDDLEEGENSLQTTLRSPQLSFLECSDCGKKFTEKEALTEHQRAYSKIHPYNCQVCGKAFKTKEALIRHRIVHTGARPYSCDLCGKKYRWKKYLAEHKRHHCSSRQISSINRHFHTTTSEVSCRDPSLPAHTPDSSVAGEEAAPLLSEVKQEVVIGMATVLAGNKVEKSPDGVARVDTSEKNKNNQSPEKAASLQQTSFDPPLKRPLQCETCGISFNRKSELLAHEPTHTGGHPACEFCGKHFISEDFLLQHRKVHTKSQCFLCEICGKRFNKKRNMHQHKQVHIDVCPSRRQVCIKESSWLTHEPDSYAAGEEAALLLSEVKVEETVIGLPTDFPYTVEEGVENSSVDVLQTFEKGKDKDGLGEGSSPLQQRPHQCAVCGKGFHRNSDLHVHEQIHTGILPYCCEICRKGFKQKGELLNHERIHSSIRPYCCQVCGKGFKHKGDLRVHVRAHASTHPHRCEVCGKSFKHKCDLHVHERIHTGICPYYCDVCSKNFTKSQYLHHHKLIHIGAGPYSCGAYGKRFTNKKSVYAHERSHMRAYPYTCDVCGKSFKRKTRIIRHMSVHARSLPYSCEVCGKGFGLEDNLSEHKRLHSKDCHSSSDAHGQVLPHKDYPLQSKPAHNPDSSVAGEEAAYLLSEVKVEDEEADPLLIQGDDKREPVPALCQVKSEENPLMLQKAERVPMYLANEKDKESGPVPFLIQEVGTLHSWVMVKGFESLLSLERTEPVLSLSQEANHQADLPSLIQAEATSPLLSLMKVEDEEVDLLLIQEEDGREAEPSLSQAETEEAAPLQSWVKVEEEVVVPPTVFAYADEASSEALALDADEAGDPLEGGPSPLQSLQQKPHQCAVCGKGFNWPSKLHEHQRIHTVTRCFSCEICGNRYKRKSELNRHQRIHPGVLPYSCDVCGKRFMHKTYLLQHKSLYHYSCEICGESFTLEHSLSEHKRLHSAHGHSSSDASGLIFLLKGSPLQNESAHKHDSSVAGEEIDPLQDDGLEPVPSLSQVESKGAGPLQSQ